MAVDPILGSQPFLMLLGAAVAVGVTGEGCLRRGLLPVHQMQVRRVAGRCTEISLLPTLCEGMQHRLLMASPSGTLLSADCVHESPKVRDTAV